MVTRALWLSILAIIVSFFGGFLLANAINRTELNTLRAETDRLKKQPAPEASGPTLSEDEIRSKISAADASPGDFAFQKNLGIALYQYAAMKNNPDLLAESSRILARAAQLDSKDFDVAISLAHSYFDTGYYKKENSGFEKAREAYQKALILKPRDGNTQTEIAMTWMLLDPPNYDQAIAEFQKSLQFDAKNEKTLQFLTQAYAKSGKGAEAQKTLDRLRDVNPRNTSLQELSSLVSQSPQQK